MKPYRHMVLAALLLSLPCTAQKGYWNAVDLSQLGYQRHAFDWQAYYPTDSNYNFQVPQGPGRFS